jgi:hypothetical protein
MTNMVVEIFEKKYKLKACFFKNSGVFGVKFYFVPPVSPVAPVPPLQSLARMRENVFRENVFWAKVNRANVPGQMSSGQMS